MDDQLQCDLLSIFHNTTTNCSNGIEVARDECKVICIISIIKGIECVANIFLALGFATNSKICLNIVSKKDTR